MKPADLIVVAGTDTISKWIMDCEARETGQPAHVSHTIGVLGTDPIVGTIVMQAIAPGVHTDPLALALQGVSAAWLISDKTLTDAQRKAIVTTMMSYSCEHYAYPDILLQLLDAEFKTDWWTDELGSAVMKHCTICSYWTVMSYQANLPKNRGWGLKPSKDVTPEDIYLAGQSPRYEVAKLI